MYTKSERTALVVQNTMTKLLHIDIRPEGVEHYLQMLVDGIADLDATEAELGLDIRNLVEHLGRYQHNDDQHHSGETVLEHIKWVVEDVRKVTEYEPIRDRRPVLSLVALLHDLGKGYTYELIDGKHTFRKHAEVSVKLTKAMLWELRRDDPATYGRIEDLVRMHDAFMRLLEAQKTAKDLKYLNKFMRGPIYPKGVRDLIWFSTADGMRAKRFSGTREGITGLMLDLQKVEKARTAESKLKARWDNPPPDLVLHITELLKDTAPDMVPLMPDLRQVNKALGEAKRYETLAKLRELVTG